MSDLRKTANSSDDQNVKNNNGRLAVRRPQAARMLSISERHLWAMTQAGEIPHFRLGSAVLYPVAELKAWLAKQCSKRTSGNGAAG